MKTKHPVLVLQAASLFAAVVAVGADPVSAGAAAVTRAGVGAAQRDQIESTTRSSAAVRAPRVPEGGVNLGFERPEEVVFKFEPPATTRRSGHPDDPEIKLTDAEIAELDEIGGALVDFVDSAVRIEDNRARHEEELLKTRNDEANVSQAALEAARDARDEAGAAFADVQEKIKGATDERDRAQEKFAAAEKRVGEFNERIKRDYKEIGDKNRALAEIERDIKKAIDGSDEADAALVRASDDLDKASSAAEFASAAKSTAEKAAADAAEAAKTAAKAAEDARANQKTVRETGKEAVAAAEKAREEAVAAAEKARDAAKEAAVAAEKENAAAGKAAAATAKALAAAQKKAAVAKAAAEETAAKAAAAAERAKSLRPAEGEKPGFFGRWRLARAERAAAAAAKAAETAKAAVPVAEAAAKAAEEPAAAAAKAASEKAAAAEKASGALRDSVSALAKAKKDGAAAEEKAVDDARAANAVAASAARAGAANAKTAEKARRSTAAEAEKAVSAAKEAETEAALAKTAVEEAKTRAENAKREIEKLESLKTRVENETDARNIANIRLEGDRKSATDELENARDEMTAAAEALKVLDTSDVKDRRKEYEDAKNEYDRARSANSDSLKRLSAVTGDALYEAMKDEKALEKANLDKYDSFWNDFLAEAVSKSGDEPGKALEAAKAKRAEAKTALDGAVAAEKAAAENLASTQEGVKAAKSAAKAAKSAVKSGDAASAKAAEEAAAAFAAAETALGKAVEGREAAEDARKSAALALRDAERVVSQADRAAAAASSDVRRAVGVLKDAFDAQVAAAQRRKREAIDWMFINENERARLAAREARRRYRQARKEYDEARAGLALKRAQFAKKAIQWNTDEFAAARRNYAAKRRAFEDAEVVYNEYFSDSHTFATATCTDEEADALLDAEDVRRLFPKGEEWRIGGDRRWLARTSVNGEPLLDSFTGEMEWQADQLVDAGEAKRDELDPSRVLLTHDQAVKCAQAACDYVRRRAIYGGFYFAGLEVRGEENAVFVDKGRYGPITVEFRDREQNLVEEENTRMFSSTNILAKLGGNAAVNPVREGEAFNFIAFRKRFYDLNANPDVKKADVEFKMLPPLFDYGYEDEDPAMGTNRTTRAVAANVKVQEAPFPAPVHGVIGVDNFNGMGKPDKTGLEDPDSFMARATVQTLDLWGLGHALTLSGNYSLGGSLYGVAASYYVPRTDEGTWYDGSWRRLSGWSWTVHGGYTDVTQKDVIDELEVLGTGYYAGLSASSRIADFGESTLDFSLGFMYRYVENTIRIDGQRFALGRDGGDGYTLLPLSAALLYAEKDLDVWRGRNYATFELSYNLGGSDDLDLKAYRGAIENANYFVARLQLARLQLLWEDAASFLVPRMLFLRADAQYASTPLIGAEQYGLGGHGTVRGYVEREFMGDSGASGTIEFRTPIGLGWLDRSGTSAAQASDRLQLVYFVDLGWYTLESSVGSRDDESEFLYSVGLGLRYSWDDFVLRFDWGVPLAKDDGKDGFETSSAGVGHASLQYQF